MDAVIENVHVRMQTEKALAAMDRIDPKFKRAFILHGILGFTLKELGKREGVTPEVMVTT